MLAAHPEKALERTLGELRRKRCAPLNANRRLYGIRRVTTMFLQNFADNRCMLRLYSGALREFGLPGLATAEKLCNFIFLSRLAGAHEHHRDHRRSPAAPGLDCPGATPRYRPGKPQPGHNQRAHQPPAAAGSCAGNMLRDSGGSRLNQPSASSSMEIEVRLAALSFDLFGEGDGDDLTLFNDFVLEVVSSWLDSSTSNASYLLEVGVGWCC